MRKVSLFVLAFVALTSLTYVSCQKDPVKEETTEELPGTGYESALDHGIAQSILDDAIRQVDGIVSKNDTVIEHNGSIALLTSGCPTISVGRLSGTELQLTLDFGSGCTDTVLRKVRKGKIIVNMKGRYRDSASIITHRFEGYSVDGYRVSDSTVQTIVNKGHKADSNRNLWFTAKVENGKITTPENKVFRWSGSRENEWMSGDDTPLFIWDDVYSVTGKWDGMDENGRNYSIQTIPNHPLEICLNCKWIRSGMLEVKPQDFDVITINYGEDDVTVNPCNSAAMLTYSSKVVPIVLK